MTKLLLYTQAPVLAAGLHAVLREAGDFELLPICGTIPEAVEYAAALAPDIVLLDFTPEFDLEALDQLSTCKIVLWVGASSTEFGYQALGRGVRGILRKTLPAETHIRCLREVQAGELWIEKRMVDGFLGARRVVLTPREGQLAVLLAQGLKNKEIAAELNIAEGTVKVYLSRVFQKLGVKDRFELALFALKNLSADGPAAARDGRSYRSSKLRSFVLSRPAPSEAVPVLKRSPLPAA